MYKFKIGENLSTLQPSLKQILDVHQERTMLKKLLCFILPLSLIVVFDVAVFANMESRSYRIPRSIQSGGGTTVDSTNYQMTTTIGQSSATGQNSNSNYINYAGFWQPTKLRREGQAMPWVPLLLMDD
jgi:hypothetical protein